MGSTLAGKRAIRWLPTAAATLLTLSLPMFGAHAQPMRKCDTALSRIARTTADNAIKQYRDTACSGLKQGIIAVDKTTELKITHFEFCETGPVVDAAVSVRITCATSPAAVIKVEIGDTAAVKAAVDLDTCKVSHASVSAETLVAKAGLQLADVNKRLRESVAKEILPYCKK